MACNIANNCGGLRTKDVTMQIGEQRIQNGGRFPSRDMHGSYMRSSNFFWGKLRPGGSGLRYCRIRPYAPPRAQLIISPAEAAPQAEAPLAPNPQSLPLNPLLTSPALDFGDVTLRQLSHVLSSGDQTAADVEEALIPANMFVHQMPSKHWGRARVTHADVGGDVERIFFASVDYLGLAAEPRLKEVAATAAFKYGVGNPASSVVGGMSSLQSELAAVLCRFTNAPAAMVFPGCGLANLSVMCALVGAGDVVILDIHAHATLQAAVKLSGARVALVRSNDMDDLEKKLERERNRAERQRKILVVSDSVFSVEGSIYNLPQARRLCDRHGAMLFLDEAHSFGVVGATGRGIEEHFNMWGACDVRTGTFGKSFGGFPGGFAVSPNPGLFTDRKLVYSLGYAFSVNMSPISMAVAKAALEMVLSQPSRVEKLRDDATWLRAALRAEKFDVGDSASAVVPVFFRGEEAYMGILIPPILVKEYNLYVINFCYPAMAKGTTAVRILVNFHHTREDMALLCRALVEVRARLRRIGTGTDL